MSFIEYFSDFHNFDFEISKRSALDLKKIDAKLKETKAEPFIIDISINGYSSKESFNFQLGDRDWKSVSNQFIKGKKAQDDPTALTVKRAIRVMALSTSQYIEKHNVEPMLSRYNSNLHKSLCHLGSHFIVKTEEQSEQLIIMWKNFDIEKNTKIANTVFRILNIRGLLLTKKLDKL